MLTAAAPSGVAALRLPSRTVAQGPTCGAQVAADRRADQRMTIPFEMTPDQADLRVVAAELTGVNACIPSRQPPAHALRTGGDRASEWVMRHGCGAVGQQPVQEDHGFGAVADGVTIPGRIVFAEIRYSAATVNSNPGESCSIARSSRNCSRSFIAALSAGALFPT